jgi:hypothetical protein
VRASACTREGEWGARTELAPGAGDGGCADKVGGVVEAVEDAGPPSRGSPSGRSSPPPWARRESVQILGRMEWKRGEERQEETDPVLGVQILCLLGGGGGVSAQCCMTVPSVIEQLLLESCDSKYHPSISK